MEIFEKFEILLKNARKLNEAELHKVKYEDIPIAPNMSSAEDADEFIRGYFEKILKDDGPTPPPPDGPMPPLPPTPPPPPIFKKEKSPKKRKEGAKPWSTTDIEWDEDEFLKRLEIEAEEKERMEKEEEEDDDDNEHDDFLDKMESGPTGEGGDDDGEGGDGDDDDDDDDDDRDDDDRDDDGDSGKKGKKGKKGGKSSSDSGDDEDGEEGEDGEDGEDGDDSSSGKSTKGSKSSSKKGDKKRKDATGGKGDGEDGDEDGDEDGEGGSGGGKDGKEDKDKKGGKGSGKGGDKDEDGEEDGEGGSGGGKDGDEDGEGKDGKGGSDLEDAIRDAIEAAKERNESEKEDLKDLLDMLESDDTTSEDIEDKEGEVEEEREHGKEKMDKLKSLVGRLETAPSKKEIEDEIKAAKIPEEEKERMLADTMDAATIDELPKDDELEELRKKAMDELERKCKGKSRLATSILFHSLKDAKIDKTDWDIILEKILKSKSKHSGELKSKAKKVVLGAKNHLWRDVRYGYKTVKEGSDTQSIYCFVDYSGSVSSRPGLIISFLGKILEICDRLDYSDLRVYTFADTLSLPRTITHEMLEKDGYEKVLANTIEYFDMDENYVGGSIENFAEVAYEINKIKSKDKEAVFFIFGDGIWTLYGNDQPPIRLKEICPRYIDDIIPFVFYDSEDDFKSEYLGKEIAILKDIVGIKDVICTKASKMKE